MILNKMFHPFNTMFNVNQIRIKMASFHRVDQYFLLANMINIYEHTKIKSTGDRQYSIRLIRMMHI